MNLAIFFFFYMVSFSLGFIFQPEVFQLDLNKVYNVRYLGGNGRLLATLGRSIAYSKDHGATWEKSSGIDSETLYDGFIANPFFTNRAFITGTDVSYVTEDYGESWQKLDIPMNNVSNFSSVSFSFTTHPNSRDYLIAHAYGRIDFFSSSSENKYSSKDYHPPKYTSLLLFSKDGGKNFVEITRSAHGFPHEGFGSFVCYPTGGKREPHYNNNPTFLCQNQYSKNPIITPSNFTSFSISNLGKTTKKLDHLNGLVVDSINVLESYTVVITREDIANRSSGKRVWISDDGLNFQEAHFPTQIFNSFFLKTLKEIDGRIFISLFKPKRRFFERFRYKNYVSDSTGFNFTKLAPLIPKREGWYEFNVIDNLEDTIIQTFITDKGLFKKRMISTRISLDNGNSWSGLRIQDPEKKESYSCDIDNDKRCSLNAHGAFLPQNQRYNFNRTFGILTAVGSVSINKVFKRGNQQTYISRDGGINWSKIFDFPAAVTFGDIGNIMVALPDHWASSEETSMLYYSLDQGYTWSELQIESGLLPRSLSALSEDESGSVFSLDAFSTPIEGIFKKLHTYVFDFGKAFGGKTCLESDFEDWYQSNGECVNGARYKFKRRKHDAQCLVKKSFADIERVEEPCACTKKDYECSPGFSSNKKGECVLDYSLLNSSKLCDGSVDTLHLAPTVLTAGNKCWNPLEIDLVEVSCKELAVWKSKHKTRENTFNLETCVSWLRSLLSVWFP